ncbi:MAG: RNA-binding S4 domain-containing protein [Anaerolineales bacterium]|nr:RNA-binding S4 domain-containing protein [Anaerolineales bacterium]
MPKAKSPRIVELEQLPIELAKLLKYEGLVATGGEAKLLITEGHVRVNGEKETRRGRKINAGDVVSLGNEHLKIVQKDASKGV